MATPIQQVLSERRQEILDIASKYGAKNVRVFGSASRGEDDASSDLDLLVEMERGRSLFDLGGLSVELNELLVCHVDVVTEGGLKDRIRDRVLAEATPL
jgi:uncharacterized protein